MKKSNLTESSARNNVKSGHTNYFMLDGVKIPISEKTADSLREEQNKDKDWRDAFIEYCGNNTDIEK